MMSYFFTFQPLDFIKIRLCFILISSSILKYSVIFFSVMKFSLFLHFFQICIVWLVCFVVSVVIGMGIRFIFFTWFCYGIIKFV